MVEATAGLACDLAAELKFREVEKEGRGREKVWNGGCYSKGTCRQAYGTMDEQRLNPDTASALTSAKSVLAIINGLTLTNTLLVLITGGHYSHVTALSKLGAEDVFFAAVLIANIVRFYHGNVRHLDAAYGAESIARAASGRHAEPRGGLGLDFFIIFIQSLLFSVASFYITAHSTYISLFMILLVFDIIWTVYSQQTDGDFAASPQRTWLLTNLIAVVGLIGFYLAFKAHRTEAWPLDAGVAVLAAATVADFRLNWDFYFPRQIRPWRPGEPRRVFLSAPLTQYVVASDASSMEGFRNEWTGIADDLERCGHQVFSAHKREAWGAALDKPASALKADVAGLIDTDVVIAYVGRPPSPGVQLEIGYALAAHKELLVFIERDQPEPYLVRGLIEMGRASVVEIENIGNIRPTLVRMGYFEQR